MSLFRSVSVCVWRCEWQPVGVCIELAKLTKHCQIKIWANSKWLKMIIIKQGGRRKICFGNVRVCIHLYTVVNVHIVCLWVFECMWELMPGSSIRTFIIFFTSYYATLCSVILFYFYLMVRFYLSSKSTFSAVCSYYFPFFSTFFPLFLFVRFTRFILYFSCALRRIVSISLAFFHHANEKWPVIVTKTNHFEIGQRSLYTESGATRLRTSKRPMIVNGSSAANVYNIFYLLDDYSIGSSPFIFFSVFIPRLSHR